jgi:hypothetical protein
LAKVENSRCTSTSDLIVWSREVKERPKVETLFLLLASIKSDNAPLQPNGNGVGPIVGAELGKYIRYSGFYRRLADRKYVSDLFIRIASAIKFRTSISRSVNASSIE